MGDGRSWTMPWIDVVVRESEELSLNAMEKSDKFMYSILF